jgi:hypothetical protein
MKIEVECTKCKQTFIYDTSKRGSKTVGLLEMADRTKKQMHYATCEHCSTVNRIGRNRRPALQ